MIRDNEELFKFIDAKCKEDEVNDFFIEFNDGKSASEFIKVIKNLNRFNRIFLDPVEGLDSKSYHNEINLEEYFLDHSYFNAWVGEGYDDEFTKVAVLHIYNTYWEDLIDLDEDIVYHYTDIRNIFIPKIEEVFSDE